jgi:hypothetical protein
MTRMSHPVWTDVIELDVLDGEVDVAFVLVILHQGVLVVLETRPLQDARTGQPGKHPAAPGLLEHLAQLSLGGGGGVDEDDVLDLDLGRFVNHDRGRAAAGRLINDRRLGGHGRLLVARLLVHFFDPQGVVEKLPFVQRLALFGGDLLPDLLEAHFLLPTIDDVSVRIGLPCTM